MIIPEGNWGVGIIMAAFFFSIVPMTNGYSASNTREMLDKILVQNNGRKNSQTTQSLYFEVEARIPVMDDERIQAAAEKLRENNPSSTTLELSNILRNSQESQKLNYKRMHYLKTAEGQVWEYSEPEESTDRIAKSPLFITFVNCDVTTDGTGFWSEIQWGNKRALFHDEKKQRLPSCEHFGSLSLELSSMLQHASNQFTTASKLLSIETDQSSVCLVLNLAMPSSDAKVPLMEKLIVRAAYSQDGNLNLLRETWIINGIIIKDFQYSEYENNVVVRSRFPSISSRFSINGPTLKYTLNSSFEWPYQVSFCDLGLSSGTSFVEMFYILSRNGFSLQNHEENLVPLGLILWIRK